jgi:hypothetical protein
MRTAQASSSALAQHTDQSESPVRSSRGRSRCNPRTLADLATATDSAVFRAGGCRWASDRRQLLRLHDAERVCSVRGVPCWLPGATLASFYTSQGALLCDAFAASKVGGTPYARPEDCEVPYTKAVYLAHRRRCRKRRLPTRGFTRSRSTAPSTRPNRAATSSGSTRTRQTAPGRRSHGVASRRRARWAAPDAR